MTAKTRLYVPTLLKLLLILIVAAAFGAFGYITTLPERVDDQQTIVIGPTRFAPDSEAALRVVVQEAGNGQPVSQAEVRVRLQPQAGGAALPLFEGVTDESGSLPLNFHLPAEAAGDYRLIVETESQAGTDRLEQPVTVSREFRLLLTTDKPLYQPGQTIHMRVLALDPFDLTPARNTTVDFLVQDAKGNKVFRQSVPTSEFGITAADFILADRVNQGNYKLSVTLGNTVSEKTVEVRPYVLPKFDVSVSTDQTFYTPGQRVEGSVQADYFFGKPVADSQVRLVGVVYDVERVEVVDLTGQTDAQGHYEFSFDLPGYLAGSGLDSGQAQFALEVSVTDQTDHAEQTSTILPVAAQPIIIEAVAESGTLRPGVDNVIYILTAYPDGTPAQTHLNIQAGQAAPAAPLATNAYGLAEFHFTPDQPVTLDLAIQASDERGFRAGRSFQFQPEIGADHVLLRADRATYVVGETMNLVALTPVDSGSIYLDIVKEGQTLSTRSQQVQAGRADFAIDLSPDLYGALELHAYKVLLDGSLVRDTRLVVVDEPRDLAIAVSANQDSYLPGETATFDLQTTDQADGAPVQTALGLAIVDESVFALQHQDPGFAKLYFLLEAELMEPFYEIHGFELPAAASPDQSDQRQAQDTSARAAWSDAPASGLALRVNSRLEKIEALYQAQQEGFYSLSLMAILGMILIPLLLWLVVILALRGSGLLKRVLVGLAKVIGLLLLILAALYGVVSFLSQFYNEFWWRFRPEEFLLFGLGGAFILALLGLAVYAWRRRDERAKFICLLSAGWIAMFFLLYLVADRGPSPDEWLVVPLLIAFMLVPPAYLLYGQILWVEGRRAPGWLATLMGSATALPALLIPFLLIMSFGTQVTMIEAPGRGVVEAPELVQFAAQGEVDMRVVEMPVMAEAGVDMMKEVEASTITANAAEPPRLRQFFPETLYWNPEVVTDEAGQAHLEIPMADSITTWRLTALASSQDGRLGFTTQGVRVFQDFFVDVDLPVALTQGDEISIPVGVFNYLPEAQEVRLVVEPEPWFDLLGEAEQTLTIAANDIEVVYFPIRVRDFGRQGFQVTAWGEKMNDAVRREVRVVPNGQEVRLSESNWLRENKEIALNLPNAIVPGTAQVEVKIYPGALAQVIEGLEKILRLPNGCFEQTTSTTYPNVLVLDYLKATGQSNPEVQLMAEKYVATGYQRLLTFEVSGGGFSLFGNPPADVFLTAYGLMEFKDMAKVYSVDPDLIERTALWLLAQQRPDGTWLEQGFSEHWQVNAELPTTAFITWSLIEAGYGDTPEVSRAIAYLREFAGQEKDAYGLALIASALTAYDASTGSAEAADSGTTQAVLEKLYQMRVVDGETVYWQTGQASFTGATGESGSIETTALAAAAFIRATVYPDATGGALAFLVQSKDSWGTWSTTQATILSLKTLLLATQATGAASEPATVWVSLNKEQSEEIVIEPSNADVVHVVTFDQGFSPSGANRVQLEVEGGGNLMYQVATGYYLPWDQVPPSPAAEELLDIELDYDRTRLSVNDTVTVQARVKLNQEGVIRAAMLDLGLPPGFTVLTEDFNGLVEQGVIARYELTGRQIIIYLEDFSSDQPLAFSYRLQARFPMKAQTSPSSAYDYYNPTAQTTRPPLEMVVLDNQE